MNSCVHPPLTGMDTVGGQSAVHTTSPPMSSAPVSSQSMSSAPMSPAPALAGAGASAVEEGSMRTGVLKISGMPRRLRPAIERAMATCLVSDSCLCIPGDDPLTAQWCTRWYRDCLMPQSFTDWEQQGRMGGVVAEGASASAAKAGIGCHQVLTGTAAELRALNAVVETLAGEFGFQGRVDDAAGERERV